MIRGGRPVYAYTTGTVDFWGTQRSQSSAMNPNMADVSKAAQRGNALAAQFPRTREQILADAEQNWSGFSGSERATGLPELAKAALSAGALDEAVSYSNEMLQRAAGSTAGIGITARKFTQEMRCSAW